MSTINVLVLQEHSLWPQENIFAVNVHVEIITKLGMYAYLYYSFVYNYK